MQNYKIDFSKIREDLEELEADESNITPSVARPDQPVYRAIRPKKRRSKKKLFFLVVLILIGFYLSSGVLAFFSPVGQNDQGQSLSLWSGIKHLISSDEKTLLGEKEDRINFLLLGQGGLGHDGPYLTDTIILVSFKPSTGQVAMISLPRDMVVPIPGYGWRRINHANAYGEQENPGHGAEFASSTIGTVLGQPIHYYLRVDFAGFIDFIDDLGGIKVCVDKSFTDSQYPTDNYQYQTVTFKEGCQIMDGDLALKFARSRHGGNGEGSDFARGERQQKIILGVKDKVLSFQTILNPLTLRKIINKFTDHLSTNMEVWQMLSLASLGRDIDKDQIITLGITNEGQNPLLEVVIGEGGAFLLQPPGGNYQTIRELVNNIFGQTVDTDIAPPTIETPPAPTETTMAVETEEKIAEITEQATITVLNGTFITGLAGTVQNGLLANNFNVSTIGNAPTRDYATTNIYILSEGKYPQTISWLKDKFQATVVSAAPTWLINKVSTDIAIILGPASANLTW